MLSLGAALATHSQVAVKLGDVYEGIEEEDLDRTTWLKNSAKNRAENIMIVDMVRNDLGRVYW